MNELLYLSQKKQNRSGKCPVYFRLTQDGKRKEFSTGIFATPEQWEKRHINGLLIKCHKEANKRKAEANKAPLIIVVFDRYVEHHAKGLQADTAKKYNAYRKNLVAFITSERLLTLDQLNKLNCALYHQRLKGLKFGADHIRKNMKCLSAVFEFARLNNWISENPIATMRFERSATKPLQYLTRIEIDLLKNHSFASDRLQDVANCFLLQCFTGLSFGDLQAISKQWIRNYMNIDCLEYPRSKNDRPAIVPLSRDARHILEFYSFKLPVISNQKYNSYLKECAAIVGINKNLKSHTGRKTFAMVMLSNGVSLESVSAMLGHTNTKTTQKHYCYATREKILNEVLKLAA
jgi:site-specific recombinase XerD